MSKSSDTIKRLDAPMMCSVVWCHNEAHVAADTSSGYFVVLCRECLQKLVEQDKAKEQQTIPFPLSRDELSSLIIGLGISVNKLETQEHRARCEDVRTRLIRLLAECMKQESEQP